MKEENKIYLAGPDVFRKDAHEHFIALKELCKIHGQIGLSPFDNEIAVNTGSMSRDIFKGNILLIDSCDILIANLDAFRGANVDDGTAFEIGYAFAKGKTIYGYTEEPTMDYKYRAGYYTSIAIPHIENFGHCCNLMLHNAVMVTGGNIMNSFEACLKDILKYG